jgi:hypothetical protein
LDSPRAMALMNYSQTRLKGRPWTLKKDPRTCHTDIGSGMLKLTIRMILPIVFSRHLLSVL